MRSRDDLVTPVCLGNKLYLDSRQSIVFAHGRRLENAPECLACDEQPMTAITSSTHVPFYDHDAQLACGRTRPHPLHLTSLLALFRIQKTGL